MTALAALISMLLAAEPSRLAVIRPAPAFALTDANGVAVTQADLKGRVTLVSFIFTTCNGTCPITTHRLGQVQDRWAARPAAKDDRVRFLSITLDPERDTPEVLRAYAKRYDADPKRWRFLTGTPKQVAAALVAWGMWAKPSANGQLDHPSRVYLVDPRGRIREIYNLDFLKPAWVIEDIELLLREEPPKETVRP